MSLWHWSSAPHPTPTPSHLPLRDIITHIDTCTYHMVQNLNQHPSIFLLYYYAYWHMYMPHVFSHWFPTLHPPPSISLLWYIIMHIDTCTCHMSLWHWSPHPNPHPTISLLHYYAYWHMYMPHVSFTLVPNPTSTSIHRPSINLSMHIGSCTCHISFHIGPKPSNHIHPSPSYIITASFTLFLIM